ncbi:MAG: isochorismatase family protein [Eubacteriales bacterium]|nr:isochorismatase family protein [Eubacteriales bacterium]
MQNIDQLTLTPEDTILLIIDIQDRLAPVILGHQNIIAATQTLIQTANILTIPILVTEQYPRGLGQTVADIRASLADIATCRGYFSKLTFSALTDEVATIMVETGRKKVILAGMETHVCVFQTARALIETGYHVFLAQDAVGSRTQENRQNGLDLIRACGGVITNVETIVFDLLKIAGTPAFKEISKLIK